MIELSFTELAFWVLGLAMILVIFGAWASSWSGAKEEKQALRGRVVCRLCLAVFESSSRDTEQHCPDCGARTNRRGPTPLG